MRARHIFIARTRACLSLLQKIDLLKKRGWRKVGGSRARYKVAVTFVAHTRARLSLPQKLDLLKRNGERGRRARSFVAHTRARLSLPQKVGSKQKLKKGGSAWKDPPVAR